MCLKSEPEIKFKYSGHLGKFKCILSKKKLMPVMQNLLICGLIGTRVKVKVCLCFT